MKRGLKAVINFFTSVFIWTFIALDTLIVFILIAILRPFDPHQKIAHHVANLWGKSIVRINPFWEVEVTGAHHIKNHQGYVLVANHVSLGDIVCLFLLGKNFKWVAKDSLFKIPFFGWTMSLLNYIRLKRGKHGSIRDSFQESQEWLDRDISVLIFPEGTRSKTGELGEFKNGAFKLALKTGRPIVPIVIQGTGKAISKGKATMSSRVKGSLKVLPPVTVSEYGPDDFVSLRNHIRNLMLAELQSQKN